MKQPPCKRCQGAGQAEVDTIEPAVSCHQCEGTGLQPLWAMSQEEYRHELRRQGASPQVEEMLMRLVFPASRSG